MAFATGLGYAGFLGQLHSMSLSERDPAQISSGWVLLIKGIAVTLAFIALMVSLRRLPVDETLLVDP